MTKQQIEFYWYAALVICVFWSTFGGIVFCDIHDNKRKWQSQYSRKQQIVLIYLGGPFVWTYILGFLVFKFVAPIVNKCWCYIGK